MNADHHPKKPWKEIAEEIAHEKDLHRVCELSGELIEALDETQPSNDSIAIHNADSPKNPPEGKNL